MSAYISVIGKMALSGMREYTVAELHFPFDALDPKCNEDYSRRARALGAPTRSELGPLGPHEWLARLFYFGAEPSGDLLISVCGMGGVAAAELRRPGPDDRHPERETLRLDEVQATVFRDEVLRAHPWELAPEAEAEGPPTFLAEFIEADRFVCLSIERPPAPSPERDLTQAFCGLWPAETEACRRCLDIL